jgi:2-polyprenyl-3-methyl-5-hydroxy-6-metoxy-1,4-benzoquinol methylase
MAYSDFQKRIFEKYSIKARKEESDIAVISIIDSIIQENKEEKEKSSIKILDVECGGGQLLENFAKLPQIEVYGVDISEKALKIALAMNYKAFLCNVETEKLPFNDDFFHIIVINDLLEHIITPDILLREAHRVLKNKGKLIISVPNISCPASWFMQIFLDLPPMQSARYKSIHVRDYTLRVLRSVIKLNGFRVKQIKGTYFYPLDNAIGRFIANLFPRLSERLILACEKGVIPDYELDDVYFNIKELLRIGEKL